MKHHFRHILMSLIVFGVGISLAGCNLERVASPTPTLADFLMPYDSTPTPTTELILGEPEVPPTETTPPPPSSGELELKFTDAMTQKECTARFPFEIAEEGELRRISGSGILDCQSEIEQCGEGVCILYHSKHYLDASVAGILHAPTTDFPDGFLEASLAGTYSLTQYWTNVPPESVVLYTEDHPSVFTGSDILPLNFNFKDGATEELNNQAGQFPWVFTLHLY